MHSVEAVLSALECCGVDNARIEMEGGGELPTLDGSAVVCLTTLSQYALSSAETGVHVPSHHLILDMHNGMVQCHVHNLPGQAESLRQALS